MGNLVYLYNESIRVVGHLESSDLRALASFLAGNVAQIVIYDELPQIELLDQFRPLDYIPIEYIMYPGPETPDERQHTASASEPYIYSEPVRTSVSLGKNRSPPASVSEQIIKANVNERLKGPRSVVALNRAFHVWVHTDYVSNH